MIFDIRVKNVISENNSYKQNDTLHIQDIETRSREQKDRIIVIPSNSSTPSNVYNNNKREKSIHPSKLLKYMEWKNFIPPDGERERKDFWRVEKLSLELLLGLLYLLVARLPSHNTG